MKQYLRPYLFKADADNMGGRPAKAFLTLRPAVDHGFINFMYPADKITAQLIKAVNLFIKVIKHFQYRLGQSGNARNIFSSRAPVLLLASAKDQRPHLRPVTDIEKTHALGAVKLVGAYAEQIDAKPLRMNDKLSKALNGIYMQQCGRIFFFDDPADLI